MDKNEDVFAIPLHVREKEVKVDEWGTLDIVTKHGDSVSVPCHYIDC